MPIRRLEFWYRGHVRMHEEEESARLAAIESMKKAVSGGGR